MGRALKLLVATGVGLPLVLGFHLLYRLRMLFQGGSAQREKILFSYSQVLWDDVWQRPQEYAWRTALQRPVVYCAPVQLHNWLRTLRRRWRPVVQETGNNRRLTVLSPLILSGHFKSRWIFNLNCRLTAAFVRPWLPAEGQVDCVVNTPYAVPVIDELFHAGRLGKEVAPRVLVYDVIDDFTAFDWSPAFGRELDARLMQMADVILTGTHELLVQRRVLRPEAEFIPCGVDWDLFSAPRPEPADLSALPRPLIGYFGTISDRLDLDLLDKVARAFPDGSLAMVGPVHLPDSILPRGAGNIRYLGLKPHLDLPGYAQAFDVGLIPFALNEATVKLNPVKTLEYLAAGLPVVSTAIPDVERFFSDAVMVGRTHEEFVALVRQCLEAPDEGRRQAGREMARRASWQVMTEQMNVRISSAAAQSQSKAV